VNPALKDPEASLSVSLEAFYHHLPLGLVLPEVPEWFFLGINISYPLQLALDVPLFDSRPKVEKLCTIFDSILYNID
jgi:hypothetical protein